MMPNGILNNILVSFGGDRMEAGPVSSAAPRQPGEGLGDAGISVREPGGGFLFRRTSVRLEGAGAVEV